MSLTVGKLAAFLDLDKTKFDRGLKSAEGGLVKFAGLLEGVGRTAGMGVATQQAASLGAALAPLSGLLYAIPAAAGAGAFAMATLKMATDGVGEAMEAAASGDAAKLQEALKGLAPEAQRFVLAADKIRDKLGEIKKTVQGKFFTGLDQDVQALATYTLPALGTGMTEVSKSLNGLVREGIQAASTEMFAGGMEKAGLSTASALGNFQGSVDALVGALPNLINAGMPLVDMFTAWAGE
ncbi:MAG TPA: hypothetical protein VFC19_49525, partial [Candidatus Limnocylindrales bacterium]|nr:hypothetical protein [Candidatus Limnocylindrales bacterium]